MLSESINTLERHKHHHDRLMKSGEVVNFFPHEVQELLKVYHNEVDQYYHLNKNCRACIIEFLTLIYNWYEKSNVIGSACSLQ